MMSIQVDPGAAATWVMDRTARMRIGEHRRLDMVLLLIGALLVGGAAAIGAVVGDSERISGLWAGAAIGSDGRAGVVEVIDYDSTPRSWARLPASSAARRRS